MLFDLASLTKPLVTAPLVLEHLDLDRDWGLILGFKGWPGQITPRLLLSHAAGLPPWLPYTGISVAEQLEQFKAFGQHPLLKKAVWGESTYSDIGYRLLAEILEIELQQDWRVLGKNLTGMDCAPWHETTVPMPPGADYEAWSVATEDRFPEYSPGQPHDANARAGMKGHAGFGTTPHAVRKWLEIWLPKYSVLMAKEANYSRDGEIWGLGLQRLKGGKGSFSELLNSKVIKGIQIVVDNGHEYSPSKPHTSAGLSEWWFHFGYTGTALFVNPLNSACVLILCHRLGKMSELLGADELRARRWHILNDFIQS